MEPQEINKLAETVEAGLRDGRSLSSLRRAMGEAGYTEDDMRAVISSVDRKKTIRRPQRKRQVSKGWIAGAALIAVILGLSSYIILVQPITQPGPEPAAGIFEGGTNATSESQGLRACYVINESVKELMMEAGAQCDKWYLIKEI